MKMACGLTHIQPVVASTIKEINNARSQEFGNLVLKWKEERNASRRTENKANVHVREGSVEKAVKLGAYLKRV